MSSIAVLKLKAYHHFGRLSTYLSGHKGKPCLGRTRDHVVSSLALAVICMHRWDVLDIKIGDFIKKKISTLFRISSRS